MNISKKPAILLPMVLSGSLLTGVVVGNPFSQAASTDITASAPAPISQPHHIAKKSLVADDFVPSVEVNIGMWSVDRYDNNNELISTLSVEVDNISESSIDGNYCYISKYGSKIDCLNEFTGQFVDSNKYLIDFNSSFQNLAGQAILEFKDNELIWSLKTFPDDLGVAIPKHSVLKK